MSRDGVGAGRPPSLPEGARTFTVEEAARTLPLVRRIVEDLVEEQAQLEEALAHFQKVLSVTGPGDDPLRLERLKTAINERGARIQALVDELHALGCLFKGFEPGLVDFYAIHEGRPVFLCWKLGEERIDHWHEVDAGYTGRTKLTPEFVAGLT